MMSVLRVKVEKVCFQHLYKFPKLEVSPIIGPLCCRKGDPIQGLELGYCLTLKNELSEETHLLTKARDLIGKGHPVESSRVREARRTALWSLVLC